jgi:hypothetical protein
MRPHTDDARACSTFLPTFAGLEKEIHATLWEHPHVGVCQRNGASDGRGLLCE